MKNFVIKKVNKVDYDYLIIATSYDSPINDLEKVETEIKGYTGKVVFDLTLINGMNSNRYLEAKVVSGVIDRKSFKIKKVFDEQMNEISREFFRDNVEFVESSTITSALKFWLKKGRCI